MNTIADLRPGDIGFGPIGGFVGLAVSAGQLLLGEGFHVGKVNIEHVFVVTEVGNSFSSMLDFPRAVEAMPSGAREVHIMDRWTPEYAYVRLPEDYPGQGWDAAAIARAMIGTPYSPASYAALAAWKFGLKADWLETWINRREPAEALAGMHRASPGMALGVLNVQLPREAICSVLADQSWALTGQQVMPEGTPHQCVTPGALAAALLEMEGAKWIWPK